MWRGVALAALLGMAGTAHAGDYCPERPGLDTPPCTMDAGHVSVESSIVDWTLEKDAASRTDTFLFGDTIVRLGLTDRLEAQFGLTPLGHVRERDKTTGAIDRATRVGDAYVGLKLSLTDPGGKGFSAALLPSATISVGRRPVASGDWGAGLRVPLAYALNDTFSLQATPEIDAAVDEDGNGRHLAYGSVAGLGIKLSKAVQASVEAELIRDRDPAGHDTQALAAVSLAWMAKDDLQLDVGANAGLNHASPDVELYAGISRRF